MKNFKIKNLFSKKTIPTEKELAATEFESTYSKRQSKVYANGGVPTPKKVKAVNGQRKVRSDIGSKRGKYVLNTTNGIRKERSDKGKERGNYKIKK